jgi:hypothetical protein
MQSLSRLRSVASETSNVRVVATFMACALFEQFRGEQIKEPAEILGVPQRMRIL